MSNINALGTFRFMLGLTLVAALAPTSASTLDTLILRSDRRSLGQRFFFVVGDLVNPEELRIFQAEVTKDGRHSGVAERSISKVDRSDEPRSLTLYLKDPPGRRRQADLGDHFLKLGVSGATAIDARAFFGVVGQLGGGRYEELPSSRETLAQFPMLGFTDELTCETLLQRIDRLSNAAAEDH